MVDTSLTRSARLFLVETLRHWGFFLSGAASGLVGWILTAVEVKNIPPAAFIWAGGLLIVVAMVRAYHDVRLERDVLVDERQPKFEIVFEQCTEQQVERRPFLQILKFGAGVNNPLPFGPRVRTMKMSDRRYRVGVRSLSAAIVPEVHVVLASCDPAGNHIHVGHRLLVMDSDPPEANRPLPPSPTGEPTLFFDVVNELCGEGRIANDFRFCFQNQNLSQPVRAGDYRIVLRAQGGGYSHERSFLVRKASDASGKLLPLIMEPL